MQPFSQLLRTGWNWKFDYKSGLIFFLGKLKVTLLKVNTKLREDVIYI